MAEECMVNAHSMLHELSVVWHTISSNKADFKKISRRD